MRRSVLCDDRAAEVIVHADLAAVQVERSRGNATEIVLAAEAAIEVLALDRPVRSDERFDARTGGPAGVEVAVRHRHAERAEADLVVDPGVAAGAVEQHLIDREAKAAANGAERINAARRGDAKRRGRGIDVSPAAVGLEAEYDVAGLPVVADRAAGEAAAHLRINRGVFAGIAAEAADVKAGP